MVRNPLPGGGPEWFGPPNPATEKLWDDLGDSEQTTFQSELGLMSHSCWGWTGRPRSGYGAWQKKAATQWRIHHGSRRVSSAPLLGAYRDATLDSCGITLIVIYRTECGKPFTQTTTTTRMGTTYQHYTQVSELLDVIVS